MIPAQSEEIPSENVSEHVLIFSKLHLTLLVRWNIKQKSFLRLVSRETRLHLSFLCN